MLPINMGLVDSTLRGIAGLLLLSLFAFSPHSIWGLIGVIPLVTGVMGYCPLYVFAGISTVGTLHRV